MQLLARAPLEPGPLSSVRPAAHGIAADTVVERPGEMCWCSKRTGGAWMRRHREACPLPTCKMRQRQQRRMPLQFPGRQHLEVNRQGSSTLVKQMACNGAGRLAADKGARAALHSCHTCVTNAYWARCSSATLKAWKRARWTRVLARCEMPRVTTFFVKLPKKKEWLVVAPRTRDARTK